MEIGVEEIKNWLKKHNLSRAWLGEQCWVQKKTVDGWLSSGKNIPDSKLDKIIKLMETYNRLNDDPIPYEIPSGFEKIIMEKVRPMADRAEELSHAAEQLKQSADQLNRDINKFVIEAIDTYLHHQ